MQQCRNPRSRRSVEARVRPAGIPTGPPSHDVLDQLQFIRHTMESATSFTAVPGWGMVMLGTTALTVAFVARSVDSQLTGVVLWLGAGLIAGLISRVARAA